MSGTGDVERAERHANQAGAEYSGDQRFVDEIRKLHKYAPSVPALRGIAGTIVSAPYGILKAQPLRAYSAAKRV